MKKILALIISIGVLYSHTNLLPGITFTSNKYNDVQARVSGNNQSLETFENELIQSLNNWKDSGYKAIWFTIPKEYAAYIPITLQHGFIFHHTTSQELVMIRGLKEHGEESLPAYATQTLGSFGLVIDNDNNILVVKERFKPELGYKLPGGGASFSEKISETAIREIKEETGIDTEFVGIVAWRHGRSPNTEGISDICFCCLLRPISHSIKIQESEITDCRWMPYAEFKKIARHICAQFLAAYEAAGASNICYSVNASGLLDLYVPKATNLTNVITEDSR
jgi:ADP-ribose pyrophosphatase YjhB (NUDIX family)